MKTLIHWAGISDMNRWDAEDYEYDWKDTLSKNDVDLVASLANIADIEFFGLAASRLSYKLLEETVPKQYQHNFMEAVMFSHIMAYEEFRHGFSLSVVNNTPVDSKRICEEFLYSEVDWDMYLLTCTLAMSEPIQIPLYVFIRDRIENKQLKTLMTNIIKDEVRHYNTLKDIIKNLIDSDPYHKQRVIDILPRLINNHVGDMKDVYGTAMDDTANILSKKASMEMIKLKYKLLDHWLGDDNPYSKSDILKLHVDHYRDHII